MRAALLALLLAGCARQAPTPAPATSGETGLERAAVAAGLVEDPAGIDLTGLYARDTDRLCVVPAREGFAFGVTVDYGDGQACSGTGTLTRENDSLRVAFEAAGGCTFDARFDAGRITFPGRLPEGCATLCRRRASLAGLNVERLSGTLAEATTLRDSRGRLLCGS